jgi:ribonuclease VapC
MVIDTSAILAILSDEPERHHFNELIALSVPTLMSAGTHLETTIVTGARFGRAGLRDLRLFLVTTGTRIVPFDEEQATIAVDAHAVYGKGHHRAGLNFGDCFAYALAKKTREPLLFKGDDFAHTDISSALHP